MRLPLIHPPTQLDIYVIGNVVIHESRVIASETISNFYQRRGLYWHGKHNQYLPRRH